MSYSVGEVAKLAKVSIRTLHHYDEIGLLVPSHRNDAGYRFYTRADLDKLQLIRFYRTLEFPLDDIKRILGGGEFDREAILLQQRELLMARAGELADAVTLIDQTLASLRAPQEQTMSNAAMFEVFPDMEESWQTEAEQRWGNTEAWKQSAERAKKYRKEDWLRLKQEMAKIYTEAERVFTTGARADSIEAVACVEADRLMIQQWFYNCSRKLHAAVKQGTSQDPRFVANIDRNCKGLAAWLAAAAAANLQANGDV
ncbi:MAG TPA: MerR family transcriptional regulator [Candidatus Acidoferrum sp.]|nr:MerR family transcriptional regulator [Candidatus Acidoferrum sp.]